MEDPLIGSVLNNSYRIDQLLADGGMSRIYVAEQLSLARRVAVKMLLPGYDDEDFIALFLREARVYSQINHPNVVAVHDFGRSDNGVVFLVMEYLDGMTLADLIERKGPLTLPNIVWLMEQICAGVYAAHKLSIVHRDLKPNNIMIARVAGDASVAKVLDFGISKPLSEKDLNNTTLGMVMGTPGYLAPEQIQGRRDIDIRADIYALGALLYFMITGRRPYSGGNRDLIMNKQLASLPPPIEPVNIADAACLSLQPVIEGAMAIDREQRYPTVKAFWQALLDVSQPGAAANLTAPVADAAGERAADSDHTVAQSPGLWQVVVTGALEPFADPAKARQQLASALALSADQLDRLFSGQRQVFRSRLSETSARRFEVLFRKVGLISEVEALPPTGAASVPQRMSSQPMSSQSVLSQPSSSRPAGANGQEGLAGAASLPTSVLGEPVSLPSNSELPTRIGAAPASGDAASGGDWQIDDLLASIKKPRPRSRRTVVLAVLLVVAVLAGLAVWVIETPLQRALREFNDSYAANQIEAMVVQANKVLALDANAHDITQRAAGRVLEHAYQLDERDGALVAFDWLTAQVDRNRALLTRSPELQSLYDKLTIDAWMAKWLQEGQANFQALEQFVNDHPAPDVPVRMARDLHAYLPIERRVWLYAVALQRGHAAEPAIFDDVTRALQRVKPSSGDQPAYQLLLAHFPDATRAWAEQLLQEPSPLSVLNAWQVLSQSQDARLQEPYYQALHQLALGYPSAELAAQALAYFHTLTDTTQRDQVLGMHRWIVEPKTQVSRWNYRGLTHTRANLAALNRVGNLPMPERLHPMPEPVLNTAE